MSAKSVRPPGRAGRVHEANVIALHDQTTWLLWPFHQRVRPGKGLERSCAATARSSVGRCQ